jgi:hypothetical protein
MYIISLFLSFTVFISFGLESYYGIMSKIGYYEASWNETSLKEFFRFVFFFIPDRFFEDTKHVIRKNELLESEVDLED